MKFAADENFDNRILRGLIRRVPELDVVRVQDTVFYRADDRRVLLWAAAEGRILLTHDERTMSRYDYEQMSMGRTIAGVIIVESNLPIGLVISDLELVALDSTPADWVNKVQYLPL